VTGFPRQKHCLGGSTGIRHNLWEFRKRNEVCSNESGRVQDFYFVLNATFLNVQMFMILTYYLFLNPNFLSMILKNLPQYFSKQFLWCFTQ
jgi:hypothetical protein